MARLTMIIYAIAGTTLAGMGVVVVLAANMGSAQNIIIAAALGGRCGPSCLMADCPADVVIETGTRKEFKFLHVT